MTTITQARSTAAFIPGLDFAYINGEQDPVHTDYLETFPLAGGGFVLAIADTGHADIPGLGSLIRHLIRINASSGLCMSELLERVDRHFFLRSPEGSIATLFVAHYEPDRSHLRYVNAGHDSAFLFRPTGNTYRTIALEPTGPVLGLVQQSRFRERTVPLGVDDLLVTYTGSLPETRSREGQNWGVFRLHEALKRYASERPRDLVGSVLTELEDFSTPGHPEDRVTLWAGKVTTPYAKTACLATKRETEPRVTAACA